jgi:uncharacterized membrane protein YfcA
MEGFAFWSLAVLAAFCVGLSKGGAPAFGALVVPILSLTISPVAAAGLLLPVFVFSDVFGVWAYRKYANWAILRIAVIGIVIGTGIGWATAHIVSDNFVRVLIGVIGFTFSLFFLLRSRANTQATSAGRTAGLFWTTIAGFTGFVSHAGAPPWQVWVLPQKLPKMVFAGTSTFAFAMMNALKIVPYYALGQLQADNLRVTLILFIPAVIAVLVAYKLIRICPNGCFMPSSHGRCCLCRSN